MLLLFKGLIKVTESLECAKVVVLKWVPSFSMAESILNL